MGQRTETGNRYLLVMVDKASKFLSGFPLPTKEAMGVAKTVLDVVLTFGLPVSLRSDPGTECRWLNVSFDYRLVDHT